MDQDSEARLRNFKDTTDKTLRRELLDALIDNRGNESRWIRGDVLWDIIPKRIPSPVDNLHGLKMCRDLVTIGLAKERRIARRKNGRFGLDCLKYRITEAGLLLALEKTPPHPLVWDERAAI